MTTDLRSFIKLMEDRGLARSFPQHVDPASTVAHVMHELEIREEMGHFLDVGSPGISLLYNSLPSRESLAVAMGVETHEILPRFLAALEAPLPPELSTATPPVQEVVHTGENIDVTAFPSVTHSELDAGPYITAGMVMTEDPVTSKRNTSFNRMMIVNSSETGIRMMPPQQLGVIQAAAEERGEDLPVIVALGMHPLDYVAGATSLPLGVDELALAGALRGEALRMSPALTNNLLVPSDAEIVIEGYIPANVREPEGPFGDFLEFYVPEMMNHRLRITAITHRKNPIFPTMRAGSPEDVQILGISRAANIYKAVKALGVDIADVRVGPSIFTAVISLRESTGVDVEHVGMAALEAYNWLKYCIVVDDDVNIFDMNDVWWAVNMRSRPDTSTTITSDRPAFPRDPFERHTSQMIIDATSPIKDHPEFLRRTLPKAGGFSVNRFFGKEP